VKTVVHDAWLRDGWGSRGGVSAEEPDMVPVGDDVEVPAGDEVAEPVSDDVEVPIPDALDQARTVRATAGVETRTIPDDVPEADALDQARSVPLDDDDGYGYGD
jgi:hypothetical protein